MFTLTVSKILLFEGRSALALSQWGTRNERVTVDRCCNFKFSLLDTKRRFNYFFQRQINHYSVQFAICLGWIKNLKNYCGRQTIVLNACMIIRFISYPKKCNVMGNIKTFLNDIKFKSYDCCKLTSETIFADY